MTDGDKEVIEGITCVRMLPRMRLTISRKLNFTKNQASRVSLFNPYRNKFFRLFAGGTQG